MKTKTKTSTFLLAITLLLAGCGKKAETATSDEGAGGQAYQEMQSIISTASPDFAGVDLIMAAYKEKNTNLSPEENDKLFLAYLLFQNKAIGAFNMEIEKNTDQIQKLSEVQSGTPSPETNKWLAELNSKGFELQFVEGYPYVQERAPFLSEKFGAYLSPVYQTFLGLYSKENTDPWASDAYLIIAPKVCAERWVAWENFLKANPDFPLANDYEAVKKQYALACMGGLDNSPAFSMETGVLVDEFKKAQQYLIDTYPASDAAKTLKEYQALVEKSGFKQTPEINDLIEKATGMKIAQQNAG